MLFSLAFFKRLLRQDPIETEIQSFERLTTSYRTFIKNNICPVKARYHYEYENNINPAYQDIESVTNPLKRHEKRIWALRDDLILATGIKNAYQKKYGYTGFNEAFSEELNLSDHLDLSDRFGHPSLTFNEKNEKGDVYYAGYLSQGESALRVCLTSGRYYRDDLTKEQIKQLESYLSLMFQKAYGDQPVVFYSGFKDYEDYDSLDDYYKHFAVFFMDDEKGLALEPTRTYAARPSF